MLTWLRVHRPGRASAGHLPIPQRPIVEARVPGEDWQRTDELVHDPVTGRTLRIWVDPADGSRYTVAELR